MRKIAGSARAEALRAGGLRIVLTSATGEQVGMDLGPEEATRFTTGAMEILAPTVNPSPAKPPKDKSGDKSRKK